MRDLSADVKHFALTNALTYLQPISLTIPPPHPRPHTQVISYDSSRGGVSVITEKGDVTTSYLLIQNADLADSGKYSCSPSNADVASVRVHVLNGKYLHSEQPSDDERSAMDHHR